MCAVANVDKAKYLSYNMGFEIKVLFFRGRPTRTDDVKEVAS